MSEYIYITRQFKIIPNRKWQKDYMFRLFREITWLRNWTIADIPNRLDWGKANNIKVVEIKVGGEFETRELIVLSSQMKQQVQKEIMENMRAIKNRPTGKGMLKFQSEHNSIHLTNQSFKIVGSSITFQGLRNRKIYIRGIKQYHEILKLFSDPRIMSGTLLKRPDGYYINVVFRILLDEYQHIYDDRKIDAYIGIDFGIKTQLTFSNGIKVEFQTPETNRIKKLQRRLAKAKKGSNNRKKVKQLLRFAYKKDIVNIKRDIKNRIYGYCKLYKGIAIQDDSIKSWQTGWFGKQIQYTALGAILDTLKTRLSTLRVVDRFEPTTQICSYCGFQQKISLSDRIFKCNNCGSIIDRDLNSARNIRYIAFRVPAGRGELTPEEMEATGRILASPYIRLSMPSLRQEAMML